MKVVWKRPDGFHGASPSDYHVIELDGHSKIWLHRTNHEWFPFRVSGDWGEEETTRRLNRLVNLIGTQPNNWVKYIEDSFGNSKADNVGVFISDISNWIDHLKANLKGDTWEIDIMTKALSLVVENLKLASRDLKSV
ncbi:MAG: hypothetical protein WCI18_07780 [Pseudomonadota bacterium]